MVSSEDAHTDRRPRYALFVSVPLIGHLNPQLRQAEELARRGWRVAMGSSSEARAHVETQARGVAFVDLGPMGALRRALDEVETAAATTKSFARHTAKMAGTLVDLWPGMYDRLTVAATRDRPDVMVVNITTFAGLDVADREEIPAVVNSPYLLATIPDTLLPPADDLPLPYSGQSLRDVGLRQRLTAPAARILRSSAMSWFLGRKLNAHRATRGFAPIDPRRAFENRMILANVAFGLEYSRPLPPLVQTVGPMVADEIEPLPSAYRAWIEGGPPVVYANLGTLAVASKEILARMLAAFTSPAFRVLWVLKEKQRAHLPSSLPENVRVEPWVPSPLSILAHENVRVFVSHCGINSAQESLHAGTPIVGIPIMSSQRDMGARLADAGVGLTLDKTSFTADELRGAILRVLREDSFRRQIPAIQSSLELAGGVRRAADLIEHQAAVGCAHYARGHVGAR